VLTALFVLFVGIATMDIEKPNHNKEDDY